MHTTDDDDRPDYRRGPAPVPTPATPPPAAPEPPPPHLTRQAINNCHLCDPDGYTPAGVVCDHIDHTPIAKRGYQAVKAAMGWT